MGFLNSLSSYMLIEIPRRFTSSARILNWGELALKAQTVSAPAIRTGNPCRDTNSRNHSQEIMPNLNVETHRKKVKKRK